MLKILDAFFIFIMSTIYNLAKFVKYLSLSSICQLLRLTKIKKDRGDISKYLM